YVKLMTRIWQEVKAAGASPPPGKPWSHSSLVAAYRVTQTTGRQKLAQQLRGKQVQMSALVERFAQLTATTAIKLANQQMEELEREIQELQARLAPLEERL